MKKAVVYSKQVCPFCVTAKEILSSKGVEIEEIKVGEDISKEEFIDTVSEMAGQEVSTVPQIFIDGEYIGGCDDLEAKVEADDIGADDFDSFEL